MAFPILSPKRLEEVVYHHERGGMNYCQEHDLIASHRALTAQIAEKEELLDVAMATLAKLRLDGSLWKRPGSGGQDRYAGMPPGMRIIDEALQRIRAAREGKQQ